MLQDHWKDRNYYTAVSGLWNDYLSIYTASEGVILVAFDTTV